MALSLDFTGRTILICGVHSGGIGGAICRLIAQAGGTIVALDNQQAYIDDVADEIRNSGGTVHTLTADLMRIEDCERVIPTVIEKFGPIDGIVNVAGGTRAEEHMPLDQTPGESFWKTLQLNLAYVFYLCRDAAAEWIRTDRPGAIVNIGSISAKDAAPWHGPYGAGKSGIIALTRTMANEWHEFGIRANSVSPGAVPTERVIERGKRMSQAARDGRDTSQDLIYCQPMDVAQGIAFLLSDLASGISGQNLTIDRTLSTRFCAGNYNNRKVKLADTPKKVGDPPRKVDRRPTRTA